MSGLLWTPTDELLAEQTRRPDPTLSMLPDIRVIESSAAYADELQRRAAVRDELADYYAPKPTAAPVEDEDPQWIANTIEPDWYAALGGVVFVLIGLVLVVLVVVNLGHITQGGNP